MRQVQRFADLSLGQRRLAGHEVGLHARDRRRDAPGGAHLAPGVGEPEADRLGGGGRRGVDAVTVPTRRGAAAALVTGSGYLRQRTCHLTLADFWRRNMRDLGSEFSSRAQSAAGPAVRPSTSPSGAWLAGLALGVIVGLTTISFALGVLGLPILAISLLLIAWKGPRLIAGAGLLTGWGLMWTLVIVHATLDCVVFDGGPGQECDPATLGPWLAAGIVMVAGGLIGSALVFRDLRDGR